MKRPAANHIPTYESGPVSSPDQFFIPFWWNRVARQIVRDSLQRQTLQASDLPAFWQDLVPSRTIVNVCALPVITVTAEELNTMVPYIR